MSNFSMMKEIWIRTKQADGYVNGVSIKKVSGVVEPDRISLKKEFLQVNDTIEGAMRDNNFQVRHQAPSACGSVMWSCRCM